MADEEARTVELVRVPRQEQVFEREQVFGRDTSSVFPTEGQKAAQEAAAALKTKLGANRFISESEIQELQQEYGGSTEGSEPIKPLAHILLEAKQAKDEAFQNQWKQMKQGKNRPLDEEEIQFVDALEAARREKEQAERKQEVDALEAYQLAVRAAAEARQGPSDGTEPGPPPLRATAKPVGPKRPPAPAKPKAKPVIIRKRATPAEAGAQQDLAQTANKQARLASEDVDITSTPLLTAAAGESQMHSQIQHSAAAARPHTTAQSHQSAATPVGPSSGKGGPGISASGPSQEVPGTSMLEATALQKQTPQTGGSLSSFLGDYGSDSGDESGSAT